MTAKFISNVLKAASVAAVPLAMLAASVPAGAQRAGERNPIERRGNVDQEVLAQVQRVRAAVLGVNPRESIDYGNSGEYQDERYKNENYKNGHYKSKNKNYKNGYYRHGRGHDDYDRDDNGRYPNRYPSRGSVRYPSSPVIPGFPNLDVLSGRAGRILYGTNQSDEQRGSHRKRK